MSLVATLRDPSFLAKILKSMNPIFKSPLDIMSRRITSKKSQFVELKTITSNQLSVPVIEPGTLPVSVGDESIAYDLYKPKPIEVSTFIKATEIKDYEDYNKEGKEQWIKRMFEDKIQKAIINTKNGMAAQVLTTGEVNWSMLAQNGFYQPYTVSVGSLTSPSITGSWGGSTSLAAVMNDVDLIVRAIEDANYGEDVEFYCGSTVWPILTNFIFGAVNDKRFSSGMGKKSINIGGHVFHNDAFRYYSAPTNGVASAATQAIAAKYIFAIDKAAAHETFNLPILDLRNNLQPAELFVHVSDPDQYEGRGIKIEAKTTPFYAPVTKACAYLQVAA